MARPHCWPRAGEYGEPIRSLRRLKEMCIRDRFHNHMTIEPVIEIFGQYNGAAINKLRQVIFEEFAKTDNYGMIFTYMWAFDQQTDWDYVEQVKKIFEPYDTEFYYVEMCIRDSARAAQARALTICRRAQAKA